MNFFFGDVSALDGQLWWNELGSSHSGFISGCSGLAVLFERYGKLVYLRALGSFLVLVLQVRIVSCSQCVAEMG